MPLGSAWWGDWLSAIAIAVVSGIISAALWERYVLRRERDRLRDDLNAFVGSYSIHKKGSGDEVGGTLHISPEDDRLIVKWPDNPYGSTTGTVVLSERFRRTARGVYDQDANAGWTTWGTWDIELNSNGRTIYVTRRYVHQDRPVEIVAGFEWRRRAGVGRT